VSSTRLIGVETLTACKVLSFMSDHDAEHDYAAEVFALDRPPSVSREEADGPWRLSGRERLSRR